MSDALIIDAVRTPSGRGKPGGQLSGCHPVQLLSVVLRALLERNECDGRNVDDVFAGCVSQYGEQALNIGRWAVLGAGMPVSVPATTIDRQCGSSQQAVHFAAQAVMAGVCDVVIACGVESMSRVPMWSSVGNADAYGPEVRSRFRPGLVAQGISAELVAARWNLTRDDLDEFAVRSHRLAADATSQRAFERETVAVDVTAAGGRAKVTTDETIRPGTTIEDLARLPAAFQDAQLAARFPDIGWNVTAGNSSPLTDGASAVLIASERMTRELAWKPRARVHAMAVVGDDPLLMLTGPIPATDRVLKQGRLDVHDIAAFEVNEAFASVPLAWQRDVGADPTRVNMRGGAIALGHPLGASGTRLLTTLLGILDDHGGQFGLQTMCEAGGMANAMVIERL